MGNIFVVNVDGTGLQKLTSSAAIDSQPAWSPDGQRIAFASRRDGPFQIYVMNSDGSNQTRLTHSNEHEQFPCWVVDTRSAQAATASGWSDGQAHLTGQVIDAVTGLAVEGAVVALGPSFRTQTGSSGEFSIQLSSAGKHVLNVSKDGYQTYQVDGLTIPPNSTVNLKISLIPESGN